MNSIDLDHAPLLRDYWLAVKDELLKSNFSEEEQASILADIHSQLTAACEGKTMAISEQEAMVTRLSSPQSFRSVETDSTHSSTSLPPAKKPQKFQVRYTIGIFLLALLIAILSIGVATQRSLVRHEAAVVAAEAQVETVLQRRYDLLPNLVATVKGNSQYESDTLLKISQLRNSWAKSGERTERSNINTELEPFFKNLLIQGQSLPELKANHAFQQLMVSIEGSENRIAIERRRHNQLVASYNAMIKQFPDSLIASLMGLSPKAAMFKAVEEASVPMKVDFE